MKVKSIVSKMGTRKYVKVPNAVADEFVIGEHVIIEKVNKQT
jgi:hypothetical protein